MYTTLILAIFSLTDVPICFINGRPFYCTTNAVLGFTGYEGFGVIARCENPPTREVPAKIKSHDSNDQHHDKAKARLDFLMKIRQKAEDEMKQILWGPPLAPRSSHGAAAEEACSGLPQRSEGELSYLDQDPASCSSSQDEAKDAPAEVQALPKEDQDSDPGCCCGTSAEEAELGSSWSDLSQISDREPAPVFKDQDTDPTLSKQYELRRLNQMFRPLPLLTTLTIPVLQKSGLIHH